MITGSGLAATVSFLLYPLRSVAALAYFLHGFLHGSCSALRFGQGDSELFGKDLEPVGSRRCRYGWLSLKGQHG